MEVGGERVRQVVGRFGGWAHGNKEGAVFAEYGG
jgi:hypothetical protein